MIAIVDYGVGNVASLRNMYEYLGIETRTIARPDELSDAQKLVLPGVGAFDRAMSTLQQRELVEPLRRVALRGTPLLGVCLGMQLLAERSAEGQLPGLGLIKGSVECLRPDAATGLKVPHIGWANIETVGEAPLFRGAGESPRYYFVHSYHLVCSDPGDVAATIDYDGKVVVALSRGTVHGVQFHPEKSHKFGMRLLKAFADL